MAKRSAKGRVGEKRKRESEEHVRRGEKMKRDPLFDYEEMKDRIGSAKEDLSDIEKKLERKVEKNPMRSVAIAFGIGVIAGMIAYMLARRKR